MTEHFNKLTPAEDERLAFLMEELSEAIQAIGKIMRHGYESRNPGVFNSLTNQRQLEQEMGDVGAALRLLMQAGDLNETRIAAANIAKSRSVGQWMHHQNDPIENEKALDMLRNINQTPGALKPADEIPLRYAAMQSRKPETVGNVCASRTKIDEGDHTGIKMISTYPHETALPTIPMRDRSLKQVELCICIHCGSLYLDGASL